MTFDTLITGGTVHSDSHSAKLDIAIRGETIAALAAPGAFRPQKKTITIDAAGMDIIPGCLDVHVHLALPFCGTVSCDDFDSGTRAAACGAVTTLLDFAIPARDHSLADADAAWHAKSDGISHIDYAWHLAITNKRHIPEIPAMVTRGLPTFKEFMIYESEGWNSDDAMLFSTLEMIEKQGPGAAMLLLHAESPRVLDLLINRAHTRPLMKKHGAMLHAITRPNFVEAEAIERAIHFSRVTGAALYIVHLSTAEGAELIKAAQAQGVPVIAETCAQYLTLDDSRFAGPDGHLFACCPQIKKPSDIERLWHAIGPHGAGEVSVISTDTCSFTRAQKKMWEVEGVGDWTKIPMGMPGLDTMVPVVYTRGVRAGRISINRLVDLCSTSPARIMGLGHRKGRIAPGFDADIAIIDPKRTVTIDHRKLQSRCDWNPFQGEKLGGFARTTLSRGAVIVDDHKFVGRRGHGRFLERRAVGRR